MVHFWVENIGAYIKPDQTIQTDIENQSAVTKIIRFDKITYCNGFKGHHKTITVVSKIAF